jgi:hypothetical protein
MNTIWDLILLLVLVVILLPVVYFWFGSLLGWLFRLGFHAISELIFPDFREHATFLPYHRFVAQDELNMKGLVALRYNEENFPSPDNPDEVAGRDMLVFNDISAYIAKQLSSHKTVPSANPFSEVYRGYESELPQAYQTLPRLPYPYSGYRRFLVLWPDLLLSLVALGVIGGYLWFYILHPNPLWLSLYSAVAGSPSQDCSLWKSITAFSSCSLSSSWFLALVVQGALALYHGFWLLFGVVGLFAPDVALKAKELRAIVNCVGTEDPRTSRLRGQGIPEPRIIPAIDWSKTKDELLSKWEKVPCAGCGATGQGAYHPEEVEYEDVIEYVGSDYAEGEMIKQVHKRIPHVVSPAYYESCSICSGSGELHYAEPELILLMNAINMYITQYNTALPTLLKGVRARNTALAWREMQIDRWLTLKRRRV